MKAYVGWVAMVVSIGVLISAGVTSKEWFRDQRLERQQIRHFTDSLQLGVTKDSVRQRFDMLNAKRLKLVHAEEDLWSIQTPFAFGDPNWLVLLTFAEGKLSCIRHRSVDSESTRPPEAPFDRCAG